MSGDDSTPSVIIRSYQPSDLPECRTLFTEAHRGYGHPWEYINGVLEKDMVDIEKSYLQVPNGHWWVAVSTKDNRVVGQIAILPLKLGDQSFYENAPENERDQTCELLRMAIASDFQRQGLGERLISTLFNYAREKEYRQVHLTTLRSMGKAFPFYEKNGFVKGRLQRIPIDEAVKRTGQEKILFEDVSGYAVFEANAPIPEEDQQLMKLSPTESRFAYIQNYSRKL